MTCQCRPSRASASHEVQEPSEQQYATVKDPHASSSNVTLKDKVAILSIAVAGVLFAYWQQPVLADLGGEVSDVVLSPDGRTYAFVGEDGALYTRPRAGRDAPRLIDGPNGTERRLSNPQWSPEGQRLLYTESWSHFVNNLLVRDHLATGKVRNLGAVCYDAPRASWSPDGAHVVSGMPIGELPGPCQVVMRSAADGRVVRILAKSGQAGAISPDGRLAAVADAGTLRVIRLDNGGKVLSLREPWKIHQIDWTPDGRFIVYQVWGDAPYVRRTPRDKAKAQPIPGLNGGSRLAQILPGGTSAIVRNEGWRETVQKSPDGVRCAILTTRTGIAELWIGQRRVWSKPTAGAPLDLAWSPDGKRMLLSVKPARANADFRTYLYLLSTDGSPRPRRIGKTAESLSQPRWSRDGKWIYAQLDDGNGYPQTVRLNPATGRIHPPDPGEVPPPARGIDDSPTGKTGPVILRGLQLSAAGSQ